MNETVQIVTLSEAKGLVRRDERSFAALRMTGPVVVVTFYNRVPTY